MNNKGKNKSRKRITSVARVEKGVLRLGLSVANFYRIINNDAAFPKELRKAIKEWSDKEDISTVTCQNKMKLSDFREYIKGMGWTYERLADELKYKSVTGAWNIVAGVQKIGAPFNQRCRDRFGFIVIPDEK